MKALILTALALLCVPTAQASYSARETVQRAQVGTFSPRARPLLRVTVPRRPAAGNFERMTCRANPAEPKTIICDIRRAP